jgi:hypothetical protein
MPDNNDRTAFMLWQGGWWLKDIAPETADLFYKALVRRNRHTELARRPIDVAGFPWWMSKAQACTSDAATGPVNGTCG